jgi:TatA/E family protein of Tat protein translocase
MLNVGPLKLLVVLIVALLVFGPEKLPEIARQVGRAVREFHRFQAAMHQNVRDVIEPITGPLIPDGPTWPAAPQANGVPPPVVDGDRAAQPPPQTPESPGGPRPDALPYEPR